MAGVFGNLDINSLIGKIGDQFQKIVPGGDPFPQAQVGGHDPFGSMGLGAGGDPFGTAGFGAGGDPFGGFQQDGRDPFPQAQIGGNDPFGQFNLGSSNPFGSFGMPGDPFAARIQPTPGGQTAADQAYAAGKAQANGQGGASWLGTGTSSDNATLTGQKVNEYIANGPFKGSPLAGLGDNIVAIANQYGVSVPMILAIARKESGLGTNVGAGNIFGITDPSRDGGLGGQRAFQSFGGPLAEVEAAARLLASDTYRGKSVRDQISMWYVGKPFDPNATDLAGNGTVQDYVDGVAEVYRSLGLAPDVTAPPTKGAGGNYPAGNWLNGDDLLKTASSLIGTPYQLGGFRTHRDNPAAGIDCSEFTSWIYGKNGYPALPENAQMQYNVTQRVAQQDLRVGDLVFFQGTYDVGNGDYITHVGMYIGNGKMINAESKGVSEADLNSPYWQQHLAGYGRVPAVGPGGRPA